MSENEKRLEQVEALEQEMNDVDQEEGEAFARGDTNVNGFVVAQNFAFIYGCDPNMGVLANTTMIDDLSDVLI